MPIVAAFEEQLSQRSPRAFAKWMAVDLHNHSPASPDFIGDRSTALPVAVDHLRDSPIDIVMFTDHQSLPDRNFTDAIAHRSGKTVLRGCELNVFVDAWSTPLNKIDKNIFFHLLVGFDPDATQSADYWFTHLNRECSHETRNISGTSVTGFTDPVEKICDILRDSGSIIIPAHLHTKRNPTKSRSVDDIYTDPEFLRLAERYFTALEVTDLRTAAYFDGDHHETNHLRKTCIRSSDAHEIASIGNRYTFVQMEEPTFSELRAGLQMPFRVSLHAPGIADSHIVGINIRGQFFRDLWLSFSPYCNAFIGVKGSGKTSVLECLRFALGSPVPQSRREDVEAHLQSILGPAGSVQVLVKRRDGARVLVRRKLSRRDTYELTFEDDRQQEVRTPDALMFPSYILGWHEIEQAATEPRIRQVYLDTIAGLEQIRQFQEQADQHTNDIRRLHDQAAARYSQFRTYHDQVSRLEDLRAGLQELDDAQLIALRDEYETAVRQRQAVTDLIGQLQTARADSRNRVGEFALQIDPSIFEGVSPLATVAAGAALVVRALRANVDEFIDEYEKKLQEAIAEWEANESELQSTFERFTENYERRIRELTPEQRHLLESHRKVLEDTRALPELSALRDRERDEVQSLLTRLVRTCNLVAQVLDAQTQLRTQKVNKLNGELRDYGVRLNVTPLSRNPTFDDLSQRSSAGASVFQEIRSFEPTEGRHHRRLARAYENLRVDLIDGYRLFFELTEFTGFLGAFEEDDLWIGLKVGKEGEEYSPIDALSAGQRCTAVFPLLLRLQEGPLIVDQPEDNLDNRHISESVAPALLDDKRARQIAFTSHNANLVVLADCEQIVMFEGMGSTGKVEERGFLCTSGSKITRQVVDILDGGDKALKLRYQKYGVVG